MPATGTSCSASAPLRYAAIRWERGFGFNALWLRHFFSSNLPVRIPGHRTQCEAVRARTPPVFSLPRSDCWVSQSSLWLQGNSVSAVIRRLEIQWFRGIQYLAWCPSSGLNCMVGPGDSGKSTILDAIDLCLGARRTVQFADSDFYALD